ncbi:retrovirus-related pol polyprotein from transposon TNT 1-94 [Tanacetum coccineum]
MAAPGGANQIARRVIDDLIEFSGETSVDGYMSFFKSQQIAESHGFINQMREEANTVRNFVGQLNALIAEMEALEDQGELFDTLMDLKDDREAAQTKLQGLNELITQAEEEIKISGKHKALFSSCLGDMVREHIGLKILSWKKVDSKARDKLWDEITVKSAAAKVARSKFVYQHTMGRGGYALIEKKEIEPDEEPPRGTLWLKGKVNKDGEYLDDEIRSVGDKLVAVLVSSYVSGGSDDMVLTTQNGRVTMSHERTKSERF